MQKDVEVSEITDIKDIDSAELAKMRMQNLALVVRRYTESMQ